MNLFVNPVSYCGVVPYAQQRLIVNQLNEPISGQEKAWKIISVVSAHYGVSAFEMRSKVRNADIVTPRHVAMYLILNNTDLTLKEVGEIFGGRDHSTVIYARSAVDNALYTNKQYKLNVQTIERELVNIHYQFPVFSLTA